MIYVAYQHYVYCSNQNLITRKVVSFYTCICSLYLIYHVQYHYVVYTFVIPLRTSIGAMFVNMPHIKYMRTFNFVDNILVFVLYVYRHGKVYLLIH